MRLSVLNEPLVVTKLETNSPIPTDVLQGKFFSITKTEDELSIVCEPSLLSSATKDQDLWRALKIEGILDFALVGILAGISTVLAQAGISIFAISTFNTDYILVKKDQLQNAIQTLRAEGYEIQNI